MKIEKNSVVTLTYTLTLADGELVEEADAEDPLVYLHGHDNLITGLERELTGMTVGDSKSVTVQPEEAYGAYDDGNIQEIPRSELPDHIDYVKGQILGVVDEDDNDMIATVIEANDEVVIMDFNHPMAGETLVFNIEVKAIREADEEEIAHGHVHDGSHH